VIHLLDLLNYSLNVCGTSTTPKTDQLVPITDALLSVIRDGSRLMLIESAIRLLLTLINKDKLILARVSQHEQLLQKLSEVIDEAYQMVDCSHASNDDESIVQTNNVQSTSVIHTHCREESNEEPTLQGELKSGLARKPIQLSNRFRVRALCIR
jgi:hypothetical protein